MIPPLSPTPWQLDHEELKWSKSPVSILDKDGERIGEFSNQADAEFVVACVNQIHERLKS